MERVRRARPAMVDGERVEKVTKVEKSRGEVIEGSEKNKERRTIEAFEVEPAYVRVSVGTTKNLGNYESFKLEVSLSVPCYREDIERTFKKTATRVAEMLDRELRNYNLEDAPDGD